MARTVKLAVAELEAYVAELEERLRVVERWAAAHERGDMAQLKFNARDIEPERYRHFMLAKYAQYWRLPDAWDERVDE